MKSVEKNGRDDKERVNWFELVILAFIGVFWLLAANALSTPYRGEAQTLGYLAGVISVTLDNSANRKRPLFVGCRVAVTILGVVIYAITVWVTK